jgi:integrase
VRLHCVGVKKPGQAPTDVPLEALRLYFEQPGASPDGVLAASAEEVALSFDEAHAFVQHFSEEEQARLLPALIERANLRRAREGLQLEVAALTRELKAEKAVRQKLENSIVAQALASAAQAPSLHEALKRYQEHLNATCSPKHGRDMSTRAAEFVATLPSDLRVSNVTANMVSSFIDRAAQAGDVNRRATHYRYWHVRVGAFLNWAAQRWGYPSPMSGVKNVPRHAADRERGDIQWHDLEPVEAAIDALPDTYWKALVACLAYAGLQLAELCWLRVSDLEFAKDQTPGKIWVTTVDDPSDPDIRHALKTYHRRRGIDMHPRLLLPRIKALLAERKTASVFLFAVPPTRRRRVRRVTPGSSDRWVVNSLSTVLRGHPGGKRRAIVKGLLQEGMNAKSLRRTFGSLLLRSGKSTAEVAAAMGNTEDVVRRHYARILGCEVDVDF